MNQKPNTLSSEKKTSEETPKPSAAHRRLNVFLGKWNLQGQQLEGPFGPTAKITATQTYEWLAGGFFMIQRFDALVDGTQAACIELVGYGTKSRTYPVQTFYSNGSTSKWQLAERDGTWILTGKSEVGGKTSEVRCTTVFSEANSAMTGTWEYSIDGTHWKTFWEVKATKAT